MRSRTFARINQRGFAAKRPAGFDDRIRCGVVGGGAVVDGLVRSTALRELRLSDAHLQRRRRRRRHCDELIRSEVSANLSDRERKRDGNETNASQSQRNQPTGGWLAQ